MENLTDKQYKTRWGDIKKQIKIRPLLAYRVGIQLCDWDMYMTSLPPHEEIDRIYYSIQDDRKTKTLRIKNELSKIVGYREAKKFATKAGVSDSVIRQVLDGKKEMAGYDVINKLEIFLNAVVPEFEISIENTLTPISYVNDIVSDIASNLHGTADRLKSFSYKLRDLAKKQEYNTDWQERFECPSKYVENNIAILNEIKNEIEIIWDTYMIKPNV